MKNYLRSTMSQERLSSLLALSIKNDFAKDIDSDRQHLSCDVCLEVRGEIIRTVQFCIVY